MSHVTTLEIELDRPRNMRLTFHEAREFKNATKTDDRPKGISIVQGDLKDVSLDEDHWILLFWIMLKHEDDDLTQDMVAELFDMPKFVEAGHRFEELMRTFRAGGAPTDAVDPTSSTSAAT